MNRVGGVVVAVLIAVTVVAGVAGIGATAHAAQNSLAAVLPPVPAPATSPSVTIDQSRSAGASPVKVTPASQPQASPAAPKAEFAPSPVTTAAFKGAPVNAAAQLKPASSEHAGAVPIWAPDLPPQSAALPVAAIPAGSVSTTTKATPLAATVPTTTAVPPASAVTLPVTTPQVTTVAPKGAPVNAAAQSKPVSDEHAGAVPVWAPDLPPHVAAQSAAAVAPKSSKPDMIYAAIPQNASTTMKPASAAIAAPAAVAQPTTPSPAQAVAAPVRAETPATLPAAPRPAAAPTALAAILPPSAAHTDYPRLNGITTGERMLEEDDYGTTREPANWIVRIFKHNHRLEVYYRDNLYKSYHAVFGRSLWPGAKEVENDRRTPEGDYMIVQKHPSARFDWFLKINYPNAEDRAHFEELRDEGKIPAWEREGGQVGIHGTDNPILNVGDVNWTTGCISIDNGDIAELARLLPVGTVVIIRP